MTWRSISIGIRWTWGQIFMRYICPNTVIMPLYGYVFLIWICKLDVICINSESRHVIVTSFGVLWRREDSKWVWTESGQIPTCCLHKSSIDLSNSNKQGLTLFWVPPKQANTILITYGIINSIETLQRQEYILWHFI